MGASKFMDLKWIILDCPDGPYLNTRALKSRVFFTWSKRNVAEREDRTRPRMTESWSSVVKGKP